MSYIFILLISLGFAEDSKEKSSSPELPFAGFVNVSPASFNNKLEDYLKNKIEPQCVAEAKLKDQYDAEFEKIKAQKGLTYESRGVLYDSLPKKLKYDPDGLKNCLERAQKKDPFGLKLALYSEPNVKSQKLGYIVMGRAESFFAYHSLSYVSTSGESITFTPDLKSGDDTPSYHTALEIKEEWVKFPKSPFPTPVWADFGSSPDFGPVELKEITNSGIVRISTNVVADNVRIRKVENGTIEVETEDVSCDCGHEPQTHDEDGEPLPESEIPPPEPPKPRFVPQKYTIPFKELLDENGHFNGHRADVPDCACC